MLTARWYGQKALAAQSRRLCVPASPSEAFFTRRRVAENCPGGPAAMARYLHRRVRLVLAVAYRVSNYIRFELHGSLIICPGDEMQIP